MKSILNLGFSKKYNIRYIIIYILYILGDIISRTTMQWFNGFGYSLYSKLMLWSSDLDVNNYLWKSVKPKKRKR